MNKMIATMFLLILCHLSKAQELPDLTNWKLEAVPIGDSLYTANQSPNNWIFIKKNGKWQIEQNTYKGEKGDLFPFTTSFIDKNLKEIKGNRFVKKIADGFLVGLNKGEFGGGLYFIENDGLAGYEIANFLNIQSIFEYDSKYFSIEGLAHLGGQRGQIIEIFKEDKLWKHKTITRLVEAPALIADYNKEKIIVTSQYILKFGPDIKVTEILKSPLYWGMLYPSSIIVDKNDVYLAMRKGVLKIKAFDTLPEYEWYVPK
jgi:hypothetical protein